MASSAPDSSSSAPLADWVHCNSCFSTPKQGLSFFISSCMHVSCAKCTYSSDAPRAFVTNCAACKENCRFQEINRDLKPELQQLFHNPKDLIAQFVTTITKTVEFQNENRSRLMKHRSEKKQKAISYAQQSRKEIKQLREHERKLIEERNWMNIEMEKKQAQYCKLEFKMMQQQQELETMRREMQTNGRDFNKQNSTKTLPTTGLGFGSSNKYLVTSTPLQIRANKKSAMTEVFGEGDTLSPIVDGQLTTPDMLGIKRKRSRSNSNERRMNMNMNKNRNGFSPLN